jgi:hypothetical protein
MVLLQTIRDFREFVAAKRRKREPIVFKAHGAGAASYQPRHAAGFERFRAALRGVGDWGRASERLDALEQALRSRHGCCFPLPNEVIQNDDRSLSMFWQGLMARCFEDGFVSLIGGSTGVPARKVTRELLDALAFQARIQKAS